MAEKKKKSPLSTLIIVVAITFIAAGLLFLKFGDRIFPPPPEKTITRKVSLYFTGGEGRKLTPERRIIARGTLDEEVEATLMALIGGPKGDLTQPIPKGTRLLRAYTREGIAFIDLSKEVSINHPGGSSGELQTIYAIVNSITLNFPEIKAVQLLIEGEVQETLAGHIDIGLPLEADSELIKQ